MNLHTFEVGCTLKDYEYKNVHNDFVQYKSLYYPDKHNENRKKFDGLKGRGILIYLYRVNIDEKHYVVHINYRINPTRCFDGGDYLNVFHANDAYKIIPQVNDLLKTISSYLPLLNECHLVRLDFCSNIILGSETQVKEWIKQINQSYIPNIKYHQKFIKDKRAGRYVVPKEEATFTRYNYVELSFYNKLHQILTEDIQVKKYPNILRCEARCFKNYIDFLKRKFQLTDIADFFDKLPEVGTYVFEHQMKSLGFSNNYYYLYEIREFIEQSPFKRKTKKRMIDFISAASKHKGISNAVIKEPILKPINIIKKLYSLDIAPMPLPCRSSIKSGTNILDLCLKYADAKKVEG